MTKSLYHFSIRFLRNGNFLDKWMKTDYPFLQEQFEDKLYNFINSSLEKKRIKISKERGISLKDKYNKNYLTPGNFFLRTLISLPFLPQEIVIQFIETTMSVYGKIIHKFPYSPYNPTTFTISYTETVQILFKKYPSIFMLIFDTLARLAEDTSQKEDEKDSSVEGLEDLENFKAKLNFISADMDRYLASLNNILYKFIKNKNYILTNEEQNIILYLQNIHNRQKFLIKRFKILFNPTIFYYEELDIYKTSTNFHIFLRAIYNIIIYCIGIENIHQCHACLRPYTPYWGKFYCSASCFDWHVSKLAIDKKKKEKGLYTTKRSYEILDI